MQKVVWQGIKIAFSELRYKIAKVDKMRVDMIKPERPIGLQQMFKTLKNVSQQKETFFGKTSLSRSIKPATYHTKLMLPNGTTSHPRKLDL